VTSPFANAIGVVVCTLSVAAAMTSSANAAAQDPDQSQRPLGHVPTISNPPQIDGVLTDEAWGSSLRLSDFTEVKPNDGAVSDPVTEVWMMRDDEHLYVAFVCMEPTPEDMVLQNIHRDAFLGDDDRMEMVLGTFNDSENSYWFQISAAGSRGDALLGANGRRFNKPWDAFWKGETRILEDRWIAEIAIPFATLSFGEGDLWQGNFNRFRGVDRSDHRWASPRRELPLGMISEAGQLSGFTGIQNGHGLEFRPFFTAANDNPYDSPSVMTGEIGGEINWSITPQLKASVTWNTDFAETEVDNRQVNLTRYPLFFPEKRDFFLQDSTFFQFGEVGGRGGSGSHLQPFFSRRIGLASGFEVPLDYGLRLAGRTNQWDLGFLGVSTAASSAAGTPDSELFVFRPSYNLGDGLTVGALLTSGNPSREEDNSVVGADLRWSSTSVLPGNFSFNTFFTHSDDAYTQSRGLGFGTQAELTTTDWSYRLSMIGSQDNFRPALGFIRRPGEIQTSGRIRWSPRPDSELIRSYNFSLNPSWWTDLGGDVVSSSLSVRLLGIDFESGDELDFNVTLNTDNPDTAFGIVEGISIAEGEYDWAAFTVGFESSSGRPLATDISLTKGDWYDGTLDRFRSELIWRPDEKMRTALSYREEHGSVASGDFTVRIESLAVDYSFTSGLTLETLMQSDNVSDTLGVQSRLRWLVEDGRELFLVLNTGWEERDGGLIVPLGNDVTAKLVYAVRF
jgi:hypothetical protein